MRLTTKGEVPFQVAPISSVLSFIQIRRHFREIRHQTNRETGNGVCINRERHTHGFLLLMHTSFDAELPTLKWSHTWGGDLF